MRIPPFKDLLPIETVKQLSQMVAQPALVSAIKDAAQKLGLKETMQSANLQQILQQAGRWMESVSEPWLRSAQTGLTPGINATGELFSSRWCTHRMCADAIAQLNHLQSRYAETTKLDQQLRNLLVGLTGAQAVMVAPNMSVALYLAASCANATHATSRWILPRMDCVRLLQSGAVQGGNVRAILDQARMPVVEIGTNQDCTETDFHEAFGDAAHSYLLIASPNSLAQDQHAEHRSRAIASAKRHGAEVIELLSDGSIHDLSSLGVASTSVAECWSKDAGVDTLIMPGDAWLGGPDCGIVMGNKASIEAMQKMADVVGLNASSSTKAGLLRTLQASESLEQWSQLPVGAAVSISLENLENRAQRLATQLSASPKVERVAVVKKACRMGAGVWSGVRMESSVLQLYPKGMTASALAEQLAASELPIWGNVQTDHVELVMRSIEPDEDRLIVQQLCPA
jgi:L-seryl-tRNA(Ser) seleniumtransferase